MKKYEYKSRYMGKSGTGINAIGWENSDESLMHTDLATELGGEPEGVSAPAEERKKTDEPLTVHEKKGEGVLVTEIDVNNDEGIRRTGKAIGKYVTFDAGVKSNELKEEAAEYIANEMGIILKKMLDDFGAKDILIIGLGNRSVTPDSLGPKVVEMVNVTRHIKEFIDEDCKKCGGKNEFMTVSAFAPGVLGITGIETFDMVKGVIEKSKPQAIIAVDALSTLNPGKIGATFQLANTGIIPGSGVGNSRLELSEKTMGIPVIALGVPLVVELTSYLGSLDGREDCSILEKVMDELPQDLMITPKSIDDTVESSAEVIGHSINIALGVDSLYN